MDKKKNKVLTQTFANSLSPTLLAPGTPEELADTVRRVVASGSGTTSKKNAKKNNRGILRTGDISYSTGKSDERTPLQQLYADDVRISKLLRRLANENSPSVAAELCQKLETSVRDPTNMAYINRAFDELAEIITSILKQEPEEYFVHLAKIFGIMGYIVRQDFNIYKNWITKNYTAHKSIRNYMMIALKSTFGCDSVNLHIKYYASRIIVVLKDYLENADMADNFIAITDAIALFSKNYQKAFEKHFKDIVDMVVGWHLEVEQSHEFKQHCSNVLQQFSLFFVREYSFSFGLLGQFLEDIQNVTNGEGENANVSSEISVGSFIGAFNSVTKCLVNNNQFVAFSIGSKIYQDAIDIITPVVLNSFTDIQCMDTVGAVNEFYNIIVGIESSMQLDDLVEILKLEVKSINSFDEIATGTLLFLILSIVQNSGTALPIEVLDLALNPESPLTDLKFSKNPKLFKLLLKICQEILLVKNVVLLQAAYEHILDDIRCIIDKLANPTKADGYTVGQAECLLNFYCSVLSILAIQTSSIMAMYVLSPSILKLLINECKLANMNIWAKYPNLQHSLINLLATHCQKNRNFLLSSSLLKDSYMSKLSLDDSSPTSENLVIILQFIRDILSQNATLPTLTLTGIISWTKGIHLECRQYAQNLADNKCFAEVGELICAASLLQPNECAEAIVVLQSYSVLNPRISNAIKDACLYQMCAVNKEIRDAYTTIFGSLPLSISLNRNLTEGGIFKRKMLKNAELHHWYLASPSTSGLKDRFFKEIMDRISKKDSKDFIDAFLEEIFPKCYVPQSRKESAKFFDAVVSNLDLLLSWTQWSAAECCVKNKLRTALGKPHDTFLKIEAIIKEFARIIALKEQSRVQDIECLITNNRHGKFLLGFLECLEKAIYNASEGTAYALAPTEKPSKAFFKVNASTCHEWFNRIRTATILVGLHCMESEMVIRYAEIMLKNLISSGRTNDVVLEHILMSYVWALYRCNETETLHGLYAWVRIKTGRKFAWIKHVADHASGNREKAAEGYMSILSQNESNVDTHIREFLQDQLMECLLLTSKWDELSIYMSPLGLDSRESAPRMTLSQSDLRSMRLCDQDIDTGVISLSDWSSFELDGDTFDNNFSYYHMLNQNERALMGLALKSELSIRDQVRLDNCSNFIQTGLQECLRSNSKEFTNDFIILNHISQRIQMTHNGIYRDLTTAIDIDKNFGSETLGKVLLWSNLLTHKECNPQANSRLLLDVATLARREDNLQMCQTALKRFFLRKGVNIEFPAINIEDLSLKLMLSVNDPDFLQGFLEVSKWLYKQPLRQQEAIELVASGCLSFPRTDCLENLDTNVHSDISKLFITLSEWLSGRNEDNFIRSPTLEQFMLQIPDITENADFNINNVIPISEKDVGKILNFAVKQNPNLSLNFSAFGNWCYRWGKKIVEAKSEDKAGLSDQDINAIKLSIPLATEDDIEKIVNVLNENQVNNADDEEIDSDEVNSTELVENQLRQIEVLAATSPEVIATIIQIWRNAYRSIYSYYEMAADAYFKYLNLAGEESVVSNDSLGNCSTVTATLRLLRLTVKHSLGLQEVLEAGLSSTLTKPWKVIIPQLFSRLNHHEPYVRKRVSELLCRVAQDSPHLIIFPAVVGAVDEGKDLTEANALTICFNSLLHTLSEQSPKTVEQVQLLIRELKRVTLLWEEFWMHSLAQIYNEYNEALVAFECEARVVTDENNEILRKKHEIITRYLTEDLEKLQKITMQPPETNHERSFQDKYSKVIEMAIQDLQKPLNLAKPNESWIKMKQLYGIFQQRMQRNSQSALKMVDISPVLANMTKTSICMPGLETNVDNPIYIKSVDANVFILPTKTKPKKLAFHGSDGKKYTYLFKGLEDLHLDERIMQFLSISNSMMTRSVDVCNKAAKYKAQHYSVIPLGPRSGLISWVDGVSPLFAVYKKWQQREAANPKKDKPAGNNAIMRPSEMFYQKLEPLLAKKNAKLTDNRKTWPLSVLRKVLEELTKETPSDLLAKEFWCQSTNCASWRDSIRSYSNSVAVMSVIGYVIGLGDRHLDNVLVNLTSGEIVHIDYNVCFEKGKTLRVPEKVPFRLTQNLVEALGVTGIEGTFRLTCEHVLKTLRKERETLLTLLEAFVYDPLVDWPTSDDGSTANTRATKGTAAYADIVSLGPACPERTMQQTTMNAEGTEHDRRQCKKRQEVDVMRGTLVSRFNTVRPEWENYRSDLVDKLREVLAYLDDLEIHRKNIQDDENKRDILSKQMAMIMEVDTLRSAKASHPLNSISQRYRNYKKSKDEFSQIKQLALKKLNDLNEKKDVFVTKAYAFNEDSSTYLASTLCNNWSNEFCVLKEYLENAFEGHLYVQSEQIRNELNASHIQQSAVINVALDALLKYSEIMRFYPKSSIDKNPLIQHSQILGELIEQPCKSSEMKQMILSAEDDVNDLYADTATTYASELEKFSLEINNIMTEKSQFLRSERSLECLNADVIETQNALSHFLQLGQPLALKCAILNESAALFASNAQNSLEEHQVFVSILLELVNWFIKSQNGRTFTRIDLLSEYNSVIESLMELQKLFEAEMPITLVQLCLAQADTELMDEIIRLHDDVDFDEIIYRLTAGNHKIYFDPIVRSYESVLEKAVGSRIGKILGDVDKRFKNFANRLEHLLDAIILLEGCVDLKARKTGMFDLLLVKRIETIMLTVAIARRMCDSLIHNDLQQPFNFKDIYQPFADFYTTVETNIISLIHNRTGIILKSELAAACKNSIEIVDTNLKEYYIKEGLFTLNDYDNASMLCEQLVAKLQKKVVIEYEINSITMLAKLLETYTIIKTCHFWMNERVLKSNVEYRNTLQRNTFLQTMHNVCRNLRAWKTTIAKIKEELSVYHSQVEHVLSKTNLCSESLRECFDASRKQLEELQEKQSTTSDCVLQICESVCCFESFNEDSEMVRALCQEMVVLLNLWTDTYTVERRYSAMISDVERGIVELLDPEGDIDQCWINNISGLFDEISNGINQKIADHEKSIYETHEKLVSSAKQLQLLMDSQLRIDMRYLIKLITKIENAQNTHSPRGKLFQSNYKQLLEKLSVLHINIIYPDYKGWLATEIRSTIHGLLQEIDAIFDEFSKLVEDRSNVKEDLDDESKDKGDINHQFGTPVKESKRNGQSEQKRNAYAVSVWRRVRMKLEGRDPDASRRLSVTEQVDYMIREAMNPDNLCVLYEGWTPWV